MASQTLDLARLQFALTAGGHFLFVALTLGLATLVACLQTRATVSGSPLHARMVRFWGQLYVINYAVGIVTGIVMEFQFGLSWSGLTHYAGDVFGASMALETVVAFFVESTFLGLWIFAFNRFNRWVHLALIWVVTLTAYASAYWILVANGFLNHPVGHRSTGGEHGRLVLDDAVAVFTNPSALLAFGHVAAGALLTAGFFMAGVSAYHLFRRTPEWEFFRRGLRTGVFVSLPALFVTAAFGGAQFAALQPMKEAVFSRKSADVARLQAELAARFGPGDYVPSEAWTRGAGILMLLTFALMTYLCLAGAALACFRRAVYRFRLWHVVLMASVPLPYVAMISGWVFREAGRQPWAVYGLLTTEDAVSGLSPGAMRASLITFTALFALLTAVNGWLLGRHARAGPAGTDLGGDERADSEDPAAAPPAPSY